MIIQFIADDKYQPKIYISFGYSRTQYMEESVTVEVAAITNLYIEGVLRSILKDTAAVSDIIDERVYWQKTPQRVTVPCVVFYSISDTKLPMYMTPAGTATTAGQGRFQFTCIADESIEGLNLQQKVMDTLRWAQGTTYGYTIDIVRIADMRQRRDPQTDLYLNDVDAIVEYFEA